MTRLQTLTEGEFGRAHAPTKEAVVRRIHGSRELTETVMAIVERDARIAGSDTTSGGLEQSEKRVQAERKWLLEVAAGQEVNRDDVFIIDGQLWPVMGASIGSDAGSKTYVLVNREKVVGRMPRYNTGN